MSEKMSICPACKKQAPWAGNPFRPFCSERCKLTDLGKWASEEYRIAAEKIDPPDGKDENDGG
jgi:hypothetical protein